MLAGENIDGWQIANAVSLKFMEFLISNCYYLNIRQSFLLQKD